MSNQPQGWACTKLGEVFQIVGGSTPKTSTETFWGGGIPWITPDDLSRHREKFIQGGRRTLSQDGFDSTSVRMLPTGSVLFSSRAPIGYTTIAARPVTTNQGFKSLVVPSGVLSDYVYWYMKHAIPMVEERASGTTFKEISGKAMKEVPFLLPPLPEQRRIVAAIEEHFSRLDAAEAGFQTALARTATLIQSVLITLIPCPDVPIDWELTTVNQAGATDLGRQRAPKYHSGDSMRPYLRVANVFEDRLDLSDVMEMDMDDGAWSKYRLCQGDILLNEGQSPHLVGRPAMYRGDPRAIAFTNSLIRFRANDDVDPEWALLVFRRHLHARRFMQEASITTNIAHLALKRFRTVEFPKPPVAEQRRLVSKIRCEIEAIDRMKLQIKANLKRTARLRRAILAAAFSGQLAPQDRNDEPASVLLERIAAEPGASKLTRKTKAST